MYTALIVEDDPVYATQLANYLSQTMLFNAPTICQKASEAVKFLSTHPDVDLVFLDYHLPDMTGLDMLKILINTPPVIITTADPMQAVHCYDIDPIIDFLPKPYDYIRFFRSIRRALGVINPAAKQTVSTLSEPLLSQDTAFSETAPVLSTNGQKVIYFKSGRAQVRFVLDEIKYAEAYGSYIKVCTQNGATAINTRLSALEKDLPADQFIRVHKSFIINMHHLRRLDAHQVHVAGKKIPIGITYHTKVMQQMRKAGILGNVN